MGLIKLQNSNYPHIEVYLYIESDATKSHEILQNKTETIIEDLDAKNSKNSDANLWDISNIIINQSDLITKPKRPRGRPKGSTKIKNNDLRSILIQIPSC